MDEITLKLQMATQRLTLRIMDAEAELATMKQPCVWRPNVETWHYDTGCHSSFDARFDYCPNCGHPVSVVRVAE